MRAFFEQTLRDDAADSAGGAGQQYAPGFEFHAAPWRSSPPACSTASERNTSPYSRNIARAHVTIAGRSVAGSKRSTMRREVADVLLVERAVAAQVGERLVGQRQRALDRVGRVERQGHARPFEHVDHAEECDGIPAHHRVVGIGDHRIGFDAMARRREPRRHPRRRPRCRKGSTRRDPVPPRGSGRVPSAATAAAPAAGNPPP